ncbi:hypothetical protein OS493_033983 [Desmophyllum pertusum]|uniref:Uncharacterized protein n=1 Tax=Desmophyllum pertusum TaxID=174260 RepID=A0A9W9ZJL0_9CNID|nr:hypothetical protein OS493_033983 [Desmophyllum pertusum]
MVCRDSPFNMADNPRRIRELLLDRYSRTIQEICRIMGQSSAMDCDMRDSVIFRLNSLRHLVVRCGDIANVPREVSICFNTGSCVYFIQRFPRQPAIFRPG